jgi:hypothetical protein
MFWKKNKNTLTFNNRRQQLIDLLPPTQGMKNVPLWWKNKPGITPHITSCPGITELYKRAITIPLWVDYEIEYDENFLNITVPGVDQHNLYQYVVGHHPDQYNNAFSDCYHIKLINPWLIEATELTTFLMIDATWNRDTLDDYTITPGMLEFKYQHACHINIFLHKSKSVKKIKFNAGSKFVQLIPLDKRDFKIVYKKIDSEKFLDLMPLVLSEEHNYQKIRKMAEDR